VQKHIILLGDSIFDNAAYVPGEPCVIEQLSALLPSSDRASLLAVDGHVAADVADQLLKLPADATHLVLSVGGNDALGATDCLSEPVRNMMEGLSVLAAIRESFQREYGAVISALKATRKPVCICTIYEAIPNLPRELRTALALFNDTIVRGALAAGFTIIDLREICTEVDDFSELSPIEPSAKGGNKVAAAIADRVLSDAHAPKRAAAG
jgi:lysophospholipase L1-like esterase